MTGWNNVGKGFSWARKMWTSVDDPARGSHFLCSIKDANSKDHRFPLLTTTTKTTTTRNGTLSINFFDLL